MTSKLKHIENSIPADGWGPVYIWHKYFGKKPWNVVREYISNYSSPGETVLDPFGGFGTTGIESLRSGRNAILIDLNPYSGFIWKTLLQKVEISDLDTAFDQVLEKSKAELKKLKLFSVDCPKCKEKTTVDVVHHKVIKGNILSHLPTKFYFEKCDECNSSGRKGFKATSKLLAANKATEKLRKKYLGKNKNLTSKLTWEKGRKFKESQRYHSLGDMFTTSNVIALEIVQKNIAQIKDENLRAHLTLVLGSCIHLCTKMMPIRETRPMSGFWNVHSFYSPKTKFMESNLLRKFESAYKERQSYREAILTLWSELYADGKPKIHIFDNDILAFKKNCGKKNTLSLLALTGDSRRMMPKLASNKIIVDYIFTDPPYNGTIQYGELLTLWNMLISDNLDNYKKGISTGEIIENDRQNKNHEVYIAALRDAFSKMGNLLSKNRYAHVTFTNPQIKYRNATIKAGLEAGLAFEKIHYQENSMTSPKALGQPFGSIEGDFYLRFHKDQNFIPTALNDVRFVSIVKDAAIEVLAHRGQPSPFSVLQNYIEPVLTRKGFFTETQSGLTIPSVLEQLLSTDLKIVESVYPGEGGKAIKAKLWWVKDERSIVKPEIPLDKRVEESITRLLLRQTEISFTDAWKAVTLDFPNSYTPESSRIKEILEDCAEQADEGKWKARPKLKENFTDHNRVIEILAKIGKRSGMEIHIGLREQRDMGSNGLPLRDLVTLSDKNLNALAGGDFSRLRYIDLIWTKDGKIQSIFEVESTTSITSALERCSNIPSEARTIVIPKSRLDDLLNKMTSKMFRGAFNTDKWSYAFFEDVYELNINRATEDDVEEILKAA
jgi:16S rRNA G966 N2-methylase RsmD